MTSTIWQHHSHNSCWSHRSINCTVLEISLAFFFFFHLEQGFSLFVLYKEIGDFVDFAV